MTFRRIIAAHRATTLLAVGLTVLAMAGCQKDEAPAAHKMPPPAVGITTLAPETVPLVEKVTGRLSAFRSADVRARVSGVLLKRTYKEGSRVKKGQQMFQIDPAPLKATLGVAEANLAKARATYANNLSTLKRSRKLRPKGYVSQSALDDAEAAARTAGAAVKAAEAQVKNAKINLGYASVTSPIDGRAGKQQVTEGALVGANGPTLLTTVRQIDPLYLNFSVPVETLQRIRAAQASGGASLAGTDKASVKITLPDGQTYAHDGKLDFTSAAVDPATGAVSLRALVPNPDHVLLPGMYATAKVHLGTLNDAHLIPQNAVMRDAGGAYVFTVGAGDKVVRKPVTTEGMRGGDWIVTSGLASGDRLIVSGLPKAKPGEVVKPTAVTGDKTANGKTTQQPPAEPSKS